MRFDDGAARCGQSGPAAQGAEILIAVQGCAWQPADGPAAECSPLCVTYRPHGAPAPAGGGGGPMALRVSVSAAFARRVIRPCFGGGDVPRHFPPGALGELPAAIVDECTAAEPASPLLVDGLLRQLIARAARLHAGQAGGAPPAWLAQGVVLIEERFREALKIESVARHLGVDPTHFSRAFRRFRGVSPKRYLLSLRLREAAAQLTAASPSLSDLALQLGFCDQSHFSRAFKSWTGSSPDAYRRWQLGLSAP
jgi:AraC-like DNA-binding protein